MFVILRAFRPLILVAFALGYQIEALGADPQFPITDTNNWLVAAEYSWDGAGNAVSVTVSPGETFAIGEPGGVQLSASVTGLNAGLHRLGFRVQDAAGRWSETNWLAVQVVDATNLLPASAPLPISDTNNWLIAAEQVWDGPSNAVPVSVSQGETFAFGEPGGVQLSASVVDLNAGLHQLGFRIQDAAGRWSETNWLPVQVVDATNLSPAAAPLPILDTNNWLIAAEQVWDGPSNAISVSVSSGETVSFGEPGGVQLSASVAGLTPGLHRLGFRIQDAAGRWSETNWLPVLVLETTSLSPAAAPLPIIDNNNWLVAAEHVWDGSGNPVPVTIPAGETVAIGEPAGTMLSASVTGLSAGLHRLGFRVQDAAGRWSETNWLPVQVQDAAALAPAPAPLPISDTDKWLVAAEYFWDIDPGTNSGAAVAFPAGETYTPGTSTLPELNLPLPDVPFGIHSLGLRVRTASGNWSRTEFLPLEIFSNGPPVVRINGQWNSSNSFIFPLGTTGIVSISLSDTNFLLKYRLNGGDFIDYNEPFAVSSTTFIEAIAIDDFENQYDADPVTVQFHATYRLGLFYGGGSILTNPAAPVYLSNTLVSLTASPLSGWTFLRWEGDINSTNPTIQVAMVHDRTNRAIFGAPLVTVTSPFAPPPGYIRRQPETNLFPYGSLVRLTGVPTNLGTLRYFSRWTNSLATTENPASITITNSSLVVTGIFVTLGSTNRSLTVLIEGEGSVSRTPSQSFYPLGSNVFLEAFTNAGWTFTGWSGDTNSTLNPLAVVMNTNKTVTANFVPLTGSNLPPLISLTGPTNGASFVAVASILLSATSVDLDGLVTNVSFFSGTNLVGAVTNGLAGTNLFSLTWSNVPAGSYTLAAVARACPKSRSFAPE